MALTKTLTIKMTASTKQKSETNKKPCIAVLLIAHGSRRSEANDDLVKLANLISAHGEYELVEVSYLEITSPTIHQGGQLCVERGATQVLMMPYFLSAGVHVVNDLKTSRDQLAREFPSVEFILCPHLGLHPLMADIVLSRLQEASIRPKN
jgi:sirohydrochlorin ferrochelatase